MAGSLIRQVSSRSKEMSQHRISDGMSPEEAKKYGKLQLIDINNLIEDPDNRDIYNDYDIEAMSLDMKRNGFLGVIIAYPYEGKYRIEAGHRRVEAAKLAGIDKIPTLITTTPSNDIERRKRLVRTNLHSRTYSPLQVAKEADYLFQTYSMEHEELKRKGIKPEGKILELIAADLEISTGQVSKYRALLNLIPELQQLADSGEYAWSALSKASVLKNDLQSKLYTVIQDQEKLGNKDLITRNWINAKIDELKNNVEAIVISTKQEDKRKRRQDGALAVSKSKQLIESAFCNDAFIKESQISTVLENLKWMQKIIDEKIIELEKK